MTPGGLFHELPGLGVQWQVARFEFEVEEGLVRLWIEDTARLWEGGIAAGQALACYDHVGEELGWRHLNALEHRCEIRCRLPRGQRVCDPAGKVYRVTQPSEGLERSGVHRLR
jgi:transposase